MRRATANAALVEKIQAIHGQSRRIYGSPRIHAALPVRGWVVNRKRVVRLMRDHGICARDRRRRRPMTTRSGHACSVAPSLLARDFTAETRNQKWVGDISYIDTAEGFLYLATLEDIYCRRIVGWAMADHMETSLIEHALLMALRRRGPVEDLLPHTDRGGQYTSHDYR